MKYEDVGQKETYKRYSSRAQPSNQGKAKATDKPPITPFGNENKWG
jgi:hypothetical protein